MKAKVLADNTPDGEIKGEWGLSIYIEYNDKRILLDTGASDLFAVNAEKYGIDLKTVDFAVLSHAHYDHAGGMEEFFRINDRAKFYIRESSGENCYYKKYLIKKYLGIPKGVLEKYNDRIVFAEGDYRISEGVYLIPHKYPNRDRIGIRENMYIRKAGRWLPDDFSHEQSLVFETGKGLFVFSSCSHAGAGSIIKEVRKTFPGSDVAGIIGGFHLFNKTDEEIIDFAANLKKNGTGYICTGHCTGEKALGMLENKLGKTVNRLHVGLEIEF